MHSDRKFHALVITVINDGTCYDDGRSGMQKIAVPKRSYASLYILCVSLLLCYSKIVRSSRLWCTCFAHAPGHHTVALCPMQEPSQELL